MVTALSIWMSIVSFTGLVAHEQNLVQREAIAHANCAYLNNQKACDEYQQIVEKKAEQEDLDQRYQMVRRRSTFAWGYR